MEGARVLADRYRLDQTLGHGGMGTVWRAHDERMGAVVAVKILDAEMARNETTRARFQREVKAAALLRSPHVVQVLDHGIDGEVPYLVMELLDGESLGDRLDRETRISAQDTALFVTHVARAMTRAHEAGIVHRDLKPDNIFLVRNDDEIVAKVLDFGIAKASAIETAAEVHTKTGAMLGTPHYMSPEQAAGRKVDERTDIWALAVIAYECLLGSRPFDESTLGGLVIAICTTDPPVPSSVGPVPDEFDAWFKRGVAREPADRWQSMREMASDLRRVCGLADAGSSLPALPAASDVAPTSSTGPVVAPPTGAARAKTAFVTADTISTPDASLGAAPAPVSSTPSTPAPGSKRNLVIAATVAVAALLGLAAWVRFKPDGPTPIRLVQPAESAAVVATASSVPAIPAPSFAPIPAASFPLAAASVVPVVPAASTVKTVKRPPPVVPSAAPTPSAPPRPNLGI